MVLFFKDHWLLMNWRKQECVGNPEISCSMMCNVFRSVILLLINCFIAVPSSVYKKIKDTFSV